ncbi:zinc-binding dehydrogenase [Actinomadura roseirufa]|uniref:zinc-binding dehydrogenase n=1 Tax=Actinomadura roseirufa TaxID=2094049 RepID=UPI0010413113|nr:alcohol dehydrogenase catalytic domain-containing protein [Actinomadura roseirufa]
MRAATIHGPKNIQVESVPDAALRSSRDAVVAVTHACVCGSDLWAYRGTAPRRPGQRMGHEFMGTVEEVGSDVETLRPGDHVLAPFLWSDGECEFCADGMHACCRQGGIWGQPGADGGQGEAVRVPYADATLVRLPDAPEGPLVPALMALCDVMCTGHHAALAARVRPGSTVAVVGDGAVGLCGVLAARRLGAERIVMLGRHPDRVALARRFGASDIVRDRGTAAAERVRELTGGSGVPAVIEAVGTRDSLQTAIAIARSGGAVGFVGTPHGVGDRLDVRQLFDRNIALGGGLAPARAYLPDLLADVLVGELDAGPVFDLTLDLPDTPRAYAAMHERHALKALIRI